MVFIKPLTSYEATVSFLCVAKFIYLSEHQQETNRHEFDWNAPAFDLSVHAGMRPLLRVEQPKLFGSYDDQASSRIA